MKKIAIIASFPLSYFHSGSQGRGGGQAATWLPQLAEALCEYSKEFEFHWLIISFKKEKPFTTEWKNQFFHQIPVGTMTFNFLTNLFFVRKKIYQKLSEIQPDVVHCWGTETFNPVALDVANCPTILSMQGILSILKKTGDLKGWRWKKFIRWEPGWIQKATVVTSESKWGIDQVKVICPRVDVRCIEYGVSSSFYDFLWNPNRNKPQVIFAGNFSKIKGVDILIKMIKKYPNRNWVIAFAGDGYLKSELECLSDSGVRLLGKLSFDELQDEMVKSWALIIPSRADTSPNVVKEARVIGLPVLASLTGGQAGYVEDGVDGYILQKNDPDEWFKAIDVFMSNFERVCEMGKVNHEKYRAIFHPELTAKSFVKLYKELVK